MYKLLMVCIFYLSFILAWKVNNNLLQVSHIDFCYLKQQIIQKNVTYKYYFFVKEGA